MGLTEHVTEESLDEALINAGALYGYANEWTVRPAGTATITFDWYNPSAQEITKARQDFITALDGVFTPEVATRLRQGCMVGKTRSNVLAIQLTW